MRARYPLRAGHTGSAKGKSQHTRSSASPRSSPGPARGKLPTTLAAGLRVPARRPAGPDETSPQSPPAATRRGQRRQDDRGEAAGRRPARPTWTSSPPEAGPPGRSGQSASRPRSPGQARPASLRLRHVGGGASGGREARRVTWGAGLAINRSRRRARRMMAAGVRCASSSLRC